jgi:hypothetical protein
VFWFLVLVFCAVVAVLVVRVASVAACDVDRAGRHDEHTSGGSAQSALALAAGTRVRSPVTAFGLVAVWKLDYELSRGLHRAANCRAERFGPMRISPLQ